MKVVFTTWCTDNYKDKIGLEGLLNSTKYFHPNIPHIVIDTEKTNEYLTRYPWAKNHHFMPITMIDLFEEYDIVVHIDGDSTITGPIDGVFDLNYDVCCVRNYTLLGSAGLTPPEQCVIPLNIDRNKFMNAGFVSISSKKFIKEWLNSCELLPVYEDEQHSLNRLINNGEYKVKILDDFNSGVSYGMTNVWGVNTHWDSWKELYVKDDKLYQVNQLGQEIEIKVLHMAGGGNAKESVFQGRNMREWIHSWVKPEVSEFLKKITKY